MEKLCDAETLATSCNYNTTTDSLYRRATDLKRRSDGLLFLHHTGGAMMYVPEPTPMDRGEAIQWIIDNATDVCTGYGCTESEAIAIVDGEAS